jgi:BirA family biotin operon repressor/biotin-[acetyl-CoA-carboxylase] ligase
MNIGQIPSLLRTKIIGTHLIEHHDLLTSTQDRAWELVRSGVEEGVVVVADEQTCGRGRYYRKWYSPKGKGLYFSTILLPTIPQNYITFLPLAASIALHRAIEPLIKGNNLTIRWPNDLLASGKKIAGVLLEAQFLSRPTITVILGIGINISHGTKDFPSQIRETAISLEQISNSPIDRTELLAEVLNHFDKIYIMCQQCNLLPLLDEWHARSKFMGKHVHIRQPGGIEIEGFVHGANIDGSITIIRDGKKTIVTSGDVKIC